MNGRDINDLNNSSTKAASDSNATESHPVELTMFYDSFCPLCVSEVEQLTSLDSAGRLRFVDIHQPGFSDQWPAIDPVSADRILHAQRADGSMLYGLDVSAEVWSMVGRHRWLKLLRLPVIRMVTDVAYRIFARYRYGISYLLTGQRRCEVCYTDASRHCDTATPTRKPG